MEINIDLNNLMRMLTKIAPQFRRLGDLEGANAIAFLGDHLEMALDGIKVILARCIEQENLLGEKSLKVKVLEVDFVEQLRKHKRFRLEKTTNRGVYKIELPLLEHFPELITEIRNQAVELQRTIDKALRDDDSGAGDEARMFPVRKNRVYVARTSDLIDEFNRLEGQLQIKAYGLPLLENELNDVNRSLNETDHDAEQYDHVRSEKTRLEQAIQELKQALITIKKGLNQVYQNLCAEHADVAPDAIKRRTGVTKTPRVHTSDNLDPKRIIEDAKKIIKRIQNKNRRIEEAIDFDVSGDLDSDAGESDSSQREVGGPAGVAEPMRVAMIPPVEAADEEITLKTLTAPVESAEPMLVDPISTVTDTRKRKREITPILIDEQFDGQPAFKSVRAADGSRRLTFFVPIEPKPVTYSLPTTSQSVFERIDIVPGVVAGPRLPVRERLGGASLLFSKGLLGDSEPGVPSRSQDITRGSVKGLRRG